MSTAKFTETRNPSIRSIAAGAALACLLSTVPSVLIARVVVALAGQLGDIGGRPAADAADTCTGTAALHAE